jgi:hypothetical protein
MGLAYIKALAIGLLALQGSLATAAAPAAQVIDDKALHEAVN